MSAVGRYSKLVVAILGVATTIITTYYGGAQWAPAALAGLSALGVYLIPNQAAPPVAPTTTQPSNVTVTKPGA